MTNKTERSFAELKRELDKVLDSLQANDADVDVALKSYERGMELVKQLENQLKNAENKVIKLKAKFDL